MARRRPGDVGVVTGDASTRRLVARARAAFEEPPVEAMELLLGKLKKTRTNIEFLLGMSV